MPWPGQQPQHSASLCCGQNLHRVPVQSVPRSTDAERHQDKSPCFVTLHSHYAPPMAGFILGHKLWGWAFAGSDLPRSPVCFLPVTPFSTATEGGLGICEHACMIPNPSAGLCGVSDSVFTPGTSGHQPSAHPLSSSHSWMPHCPNWPGMQSCL